MDGRDGGRLQEENVKAEELKVRRLEAEKAIAAANASWWRKPDPLLLAIVAGIITLFGNIGVAFYNGKESIRQEVKKASDDIDLEREKQKYSLILQAIATGDSRAAATNINFFIAAHLLKDDDNSIRNAVAKYLPTLPSPSLSLPARRGLQEQIGVLSPSQVEALAREMQPVLAAASPQVQGLVRALDPLSARFTDPVIATRVLEAWVLMGIDDPTVLQKWADAIKHINPQ